MITDPKLEKEILRRQDEGKRPHVIAAEMGLHREDVLQICSRKLSAIGTQDLIRGWKITN